MNYLEPIIAKAAQAIPRAKGDFEKNGLLHCGKCNTPKQTIITVMGITQPVMCLCACQQAEREQEEKALAKRQEALRIDKMRTNGLKDRSIRDMRFERDDGKSPDAIYKARQYVKNWEKMRRDNIGLLLWGNTGNGKTFAAGCISNALIDMGQPVLMTSFPRILSALTGMFNEDRVEYIEALNKYALLVIDDLGAERQSEYAMEQVYNVIDTRYKAKKPLIVTTNLPLGEMQHAKNMDHQRIYDRVLEMCIPVQYAGQSRRKGIAADKRDAMKILFAGGDGDGN